MDILFAIIIIVLVVVIPSIKIVPQAKSYVIERLGSYYKTWGNGIHFKVPFIDRIANITSMKEIVKDFAKTIHIENNFELDAYKEVLSNAKNIGITAGASTPQNIIDNPADLFVENFVLKNLKMKIDSLFKYVK